MSYIIKVNKPRKAVKPRKVKSVSNKRVFPKYVEGMSTLAYIQAYHAANASVMLSTVEYACK